MTMRGLPDAKCSALHGVDDILVVQQLVDEGLLAGKLERANAQVEAAVQLVDGIIDAATEIPAHGWGEDAVNNGNGGENREDDHQPYRNCNGLGQFGTFNSASRCLCQEMRLA